MERLSVYLDSMEKAKGNRKAALNNYNAARAAYTEAFLPKGGNPSVQSLQRLLILSESSEGFSRSNVFICSALLLYNPEALFGGKIKIRLAKQIAQVLGVTHSSVYIARKKVSLWLNVYPEFFRIINAIYCQFHDEPTS